jgi:hypothetical protein
LLSALNTKCFGVDDVLTLLASIGADRRRVLFPLLPSFQTDLCPRSGDGLRQAKFFTTVSWIRHVSNLLTTRVVVKAIAAQIICRCGSLPTGSQWPMAFVSHVEAELIPERTATQIRPKPLSELWLDLGRRSPPDGTLVQQPADSDPAAAAGPFSRSAGCAPACTRHARKGRPWPRRCPADGAMTMAFSRHRQSGRATATRFSGRRTSGQDRARTRTEGGSLAAAKDERTGELMPGAGYHGS